MSFEENIEKAVEIVRKRDSLKKELSKLTPEIKKHLMKNPNTEYEYGGYIFEYISLHKGITQYLSIRKR